MRKLKIIAVIIIILAVSALTALFIYKDFRKTRSREGTNNAQNQTEFIAKNKTAAEQEKNQTVEPTASSPVSGNGEESRKKIPNLSGPIEIKVDLPEDIKEKTISEIQMLSNGLKKDPDSLEGWLQMGLLKKLIGDYEGAKSAWEFAAVIRPKSHIPFHNLGFLYWQYLKDFSSSEQNYLKAIENNSEDIGAYVDLSNVYYFDLKNNKKAEGILLKGLKDNPGNLELLSSLEDLRTRTNP